MTNSRPFSQACENNKAFILEKLVTVVQPGQSILEVGSGTAQHARYFARHLPAISWQPAEIRDHMNTLQAGLQDHELANLKEPVIAEAGYQWPQEKFDGVFSANCLHIMSAGQVEQFFEGMKSLVVPGGFLCIYGPFNYEGQFSSASNARFDEWLRARDPLSGVRDFEWISELATQAGFSLVADHPMPANNRFLHWQKREGQV